MRNVCNNRRKPMKKDQSTAYRNLKSPNIKTRKRALKIIKQYRKKGK